MSMPAIAVVILLAQILCAIHVARTGRQFYWIYIIVFVPLVGIAAYFIVEILPELMGSRTARRAVSGVGKALDPGRAVREAERRLAMTPTAENKATLAEAYLDAGRAEEAVALFRDTLVGVHATDPALMFGLARAYFACGAYADTVRTLDALREANPDYQSPEAHLLYARSLEEQGMNEAALHEYAELARYYPGQEARCRYAMLLAKSGDGQTAERNFREICQAIELGPRHQRREQREWYDIARRALGT
jgi:hypothetical protein